MTHSAIRITSYWIQDYHRSGWGVALRALRPLDSSAGILCDCIIEKKFAFGHDVGDRNAACKPYSEPWIGFIHNPPYVPAVFGAKNSLSAIFGTSCWTDSLEHCQGLFTLSRYLATWLRTQLPLRISPLLHPADRPRTCFSADHFVAQSRPKVLHVGWWLRKFQTFFRLKAPAFSKVLLHIDRPWVNSVIAAEIAAVSREDASSFDVVRHVSDARYDELLASSVVFLDLYDSSANNLIIECIMRRTPIVVNRHSAVEEYLGTDYPLYFDTLEAAQELLASPRALLVGHEYLKANSELTERLRPGRFYRSFVESDVMQSLTPMFMQYSAAANVQDLR